MWQIYSIYSELRCQTSRTPRIINTSFQHYLHHAEGAVGKPRHTGFFIKASFWSWGDWMRNWKKYLLWSQEQAHNTKQETSLANIEIMLSYRVSLSIAENELWQNLFYFCIHVKQVKRASTLFSMLNGCSPFAKCIIPHVWGQEFESLLSLVRIPVKVQSMVGGSHGPLILISTCSCSRNFLGIRIFTAKWVYPIPELLGIV